MAARKEARYMVNNIPKLKSKIPIKIVYEGTTTPPPTWPFPSSGTQRAHNNK